MSTATLTLALYKAKFNLCPEWLRLKALALHKELNKPHIKKPNLEVDTSDVSKDKPDKPDGKPDKQNEKPDVKSHDKPDDNSE